MERRAALFGNVQNQRRRSKALRTVEHSGEGQDLLLNGEGKS